jgi:hypothetical protein
VLANMSLSDERSKIERLLVLALGSEQVNEALAARNAIKNMLASEGLDIHEFAARLRSNKLSEAEMKRIYDAGYDAGVQDEKSAAETNIKFAEVDEPSSHVEMARFCIDHNRGMTAWERDFVNDVLHWHRPSPKMLAKIQQIYAQQKRRHR